jgi:hypothetical protein
VGNYLSSYLGTQRVEVTVRNLSETADLVVAIEVSAHARPPVVLTKDGTFGEGSLQRSMFRAGDVLARTATRATLAGPAEFERWMNAAETRGEQRAYDLMRRIADRPAGYEVILSPPETLTARLSAAALAFAADPSKLLDGDDLLRAATEDERLDLPNSHDLVPELLLQSALRKRATLWWWLAELDPDPEWLAGQLARVPQARDRDVSDSGKALLEVAAVVCPESFTDLRQALASSTKYSHFRGAAETYPDVPATLAALRKRAAKVDGRPARSEVQQAFEAALRSTSRRGPLSSATKLSLARWASEVGLSNAVLE